ncbi:4680_t:CDS:2 [Paraglomus occultum]|uniref:4680_t:CDS:1 n=1 Tax=Paraglomus occultum TaxID=144539 RepID=A0A9N9G2M2_9GLOM|nr:4680_t:CDS:2 [Paraglomus occultum]
MSRYEVLQNVDEGGRQLEVEDVEHEFKTPRIKVGSVNLETRDHNQLGKAASDIAELGNTCLTIIKNPVAWFDGLIWIRCRAREEAVQKAREYVDEMRKIPPPPLLLAGIKKYVFIFIQRINIKKINNLIRHAF